MPPVHFPSTSQSCARLALPSSYNNFNHDHNKRISPPLLRLSDLFNTAICWSCNKEPSSRFFLSLFPAPRPVSHRDFSVLSSYSSASVETSPSEASPTSTTTTNLQLFAPQRHPSIVRSLFTFRHTHHLL